MAIMSPQTLASHLLRQSILTIILSSAAIVPPPWADPSINPCASQPGGWQLLYWQDDGKCYKIFQKGYPCPDTMELSPAPVGNKGMTKAECRCPPGTAQSPRDALCHPIFTRASCSEGQYFAPVPESSGKQSSAKKRWGVCRDQEACESSSHVFWPRDAKCYRKHTRGPCQRGELLILDGDGLAACSCSREGELSKHYSIAGGCYEHYTKGPCQEPGELFLPNGKCGCNEKMSEYYEPDGMCYQLGGIGPCAPGHQFVVLNNGSTAKHRARATCSCEPNYVKYTDGLCYRLHTQGPCQPGDMLANSTSCAPVPCRRGRLYFPRERTCYKVGSRGPCSSGRIVLYDYSVRPSIDGISYNGVCGCTDALKQAGKCAAEQGALAAASLPEKCEREPGMVSIAGGCYKLYSQGPCSDGEWLVAQRQAKDNDLWSSGERMAKARCACKPGYKRASELELDNLLMPPAKCQPPSVGLAKFLNERVKSLAV